MICQRCVYRACVTSLSLARSAISPTVGNASHPPASSRHPKSPLAAVKVSRIQPYSTSSSSATTTPEVELKSSAPAGTPLAGLGYLKGKEPPVAKEDNEYPEWLWGLLDDTKSNSKEAEDGGDAFAKSKKMRRLAAKAALKAEKANPGRRVTKIPLEHQSIDLPGGDGTAEGSLQALKAREALTEALRKSRRKGIKEGNFLKTMR